MEFIQRLTNERSLLNTCLRRTLKFCCTHRVHCFRDLWLKPDVFRKTSAGTAFTTTPPYPRVSFTLTPVSKPNLGNGEVVSRYLDGVQPTYIFACFFLASEENTKINRHVVQTFFFFGLRRHLRRKSTYCQKYPHKCLPVASFSGQRGRFTNFESNSWKFITRKGRVSYSIWLKKYGGRLYTGQVSRVIAVTLLIRSDFHVIKKHTGSTLGTSTQPGCPPGGWASHKLRRHKWKERRHEHFSSSSSSS